MSLTRPKYDDCYVGESQKQCEGAFGYQIYAPKNESVQRCTKDKNKELDFVQRVSLDSNMKQLGVPLGKCDENRHQPACEHPPCSGNGELRKITKNTDMVWQPPTSCAPYHQSTFQNNNPKPTGKPFDPKNYEYKE